MTSPHSQVIISLPFADNCSLFFSYLSLSVTFLSSFVLGNNHASSVNILPSCFHSISFSALLLFQGCSVGIVYDIIFVLLGVRLSIFCSFPKLLLCSLHIVHSALLKSLLCFLHNVASCLFRQP